jgi:hypothetical protein
MSILGPNSYYTATRTGLRGTKIMGLSSYTLVTWGGCTTLSSSRPFRFAKYLFIYLLVIFVQVVYFQFCLYFYLYTKIHKN